jgi:methylated-DNA-protein-cysteine methyltransferase-like protein
MPSTADLYIRIYEVVQKIPVGYVSTYGAIAGAIGVRSGARVIGYALNHLILHSPPPHVTEILTPYTLTTVPAHRVVNRLGQLTGRGYFPGNTMAEALQSEGVSFIEPYTVDIKKHFWDPETHL